MVTMLLAVCVLPMAASVVAWYASEEHQRGVNWAIYDAERYGLRMLREQQWERERAARMDRSFEGAPPRRFRPAPWGGCVYDVIGGGVA